MPLSIIRDTARLSPELGPRVPLVPMDKDEMDTLLHRILQTGEANSEKLATLTEQIRQQNIVMEEFRRVQADQGVLLAEYKMLRRLSLVIGAAFVAILVAVVGATVTSWLAVKLGFK